MSDSDIESADSTMEGNGNHGGGSAAGPGFGAVEREQLIGRLGEETFDLLVIGGGITGAGIAWDAASRGLKVALVEMQDFAGGTSSRSTKLIHGGLRYLKQLEFKLVREVGRERTIVHRAFPHLVVPEPMLLPVVEGGTYGRRGVSFGLWFYELLAGVKRKERRVMLSADETLKRESGLRKSGLKGAGLYTEYRTDDARLCVEVFRLAASFGAVCLNYVKAENLSYNASGKVCGAVLTDMLGQRRFQVSACAVVNAAGPWVDGLRKLDQSLMGKRLHHTKGVHLVFDHVRLPLKHAVYFDVPGGRMIFAIPRGETTYVGTTDTHFTGPLKHPDTKVADVEYLLKGVNMMFPKARLVPEDVVSTWSGIRPLIHQDGKSPSELSRKDELFFSPSGLITIAGGKLTGFRKMAERATDAVVKRLASEGHLKRRVKCRTHLLTSAVGVDFGGVLKGHLADSRVSEADLSIWAGRFRETALFKALDFYGPAWDLIFFYAVGYLHGKVGRPGGGGAAGDGAAGVSGGRVHVVLEGAKADGPQGNSGSHFGYVSHRELDLALIKGVTQFCVSFESAVMISDILIRRTGLLYFGRERIPELLEAVCEVLRESLSWGEDAEVASREEFRGAYQEVMGWKKRLSLEFR